MLDISKILSSTFARKLGYKAIPAAIERELLAIAHENAFHPVLDYLNELVWDEQPRLNAWLSKYCGAKPTELNAEFGSKMLIAGVRRIKRPGIKFDTMLVLEGAQGKGKSLVAQTLAVREDWFCASLDLGTDDKTKGELLSGAWVVECQELDGIKSTTTQSLKKFLSNSVDKYRRAYGRDAKDHPRQCIIFGTTNDTTYLRDLTGNRRFWPVEAGEIDIEALTKDVNQLWAEAVVRERQGESITLSKHLWEAAAVLQRERMVEDAFANALQDALGQLTGRISMDSVKLYLGLDTAKMKPSDIRRIKSAMAELGWEYKTHRMHDLSGTQKKPMHGFARGTDEEQKIELWAKRKEPGVVVIVRFESDGDAVTPF